MATITSSPSPAACSSSVSQFNMIVQVDAVSATVGGQVDITAAIHLQPAVFDRGFASQSPQAAPEPTQQEQPQQHAVPTGAQQHAVPTAAQQHAGSIQVVMEHLLESQQARWQDGSIIAGSRDGGSRPDSPRGRAAYAGLRDAVFDIIAPRDWVAQLPDPPGACVLANVQWTASRTCQQRAQQACLCGCLDQSQDIHHSTRFSGRLLGC